MSWQALARPSHRVTGGTEANLTTEPERRAERCASSVKRRDTLCRQVRPAHHAEGVSSTRHAEGVLPARRVALARPAGSCWKHAFSMTRASTVSVGYAFRRAPAGPARARAMTLREPVSKSG